MQLESCESFQFRELFRLSHAIRRPLISKLGIGRVKSGRRSPEQKREDQRQEGASRKWVLRELASRYNREEIYREIWSEPIQRVAKKYNISDVGLAKICKKLNIPRPGRGYWAKKAAGRSVSSQRPLPELTF